jgi:hypothetical protein
MRVLFRAIESMVVGFITSGAIARKMAATHEWYVSRGYHTVTQPLSVWKIILLALIVALILFAVSSVVAAMRKWAKPVETKAAATTN